MHMRDQAWSMLTEGEGNEQFSSSAVDECKPGSIRCGDGCGREAASVEAGGRRNDKSC